LFKEKATRLNTKPEQELSHQLSRDNSQINCFFKACDRDASEKLLKEAYTCKISNILI
jgi:hypothetical protein